MVHESNDKLGDHYDYDNNAEYLIGRLDVSRL
jgi:hypothetical protein